MSDASKRPTKVQRVAISRVDFYFDEWLTGTFELTAEQRGVFITLCALFWSKEGYLPDNDRWVAGMCNISVRKWKSIKSELLSLGKVEIIDGLIRQERAEIELINAVNGKLAKSEIGAKGGNKKAENRRKLLGNNKAPSSTGTSAATSKDVAQQVPRARVPSPPPINPLNPPTGDLSDFEENQAELLFQSVERFIDKRWPDDPTPRSGNAFYALSESCRALASDGITVEVFEHLMAPEFQPGRITRVPLQGLGAWRDRLIRHLRHWIELKRGRRWSGVGPEPAPEALARFFVPDAYRLPTDAGRPPMVEPDDEPAPPPTEPTPAVRKPRPRFSEASPGRANTRISAKGENPMTTLYETLGLNPDCDLAAIKAAHRAKAKQYHPDVVETGDVERFLAVTTAYRVLSDPERRERYDRDGTYDDGAVKTEAQKIASNLAGVFSRLLDSGQATDPTVSVVDEMRKIIREGNAKMRTAMDEMDLELKKLDSVRETITRKDEDGPNVFASVIDARAAKVRDLRAQAQAEHDMGMKMLDELEQYDSFARAARSQVYFGLAGAPAQRVQRR